MTYVKYNVKDNAFGNLLSGIGASTTTINLESGDGARFPTSNYIATLVKYTTTGDDTTPILASEKILVVSRSTDTLTVTRGFDGDTPTSFDAGDNMYLNIVSKVVQDIQDEVTRLETDKLNVSTFNSTLRNNLGNWKVIYTNGSGDETELTLGSNGQFLKSNGATSDPTWEAPSADINGLTLDNDTIDTNDMLLYYDGTSNKKRNAKASTTQEGLVRQLTDTQAKSGSTDGYVNGSQLIDEVTNRPGVIIAGNTYTASSHAGLSFTNTSYASKFGGTILRNGTYRFNLNVNGSTGNTTFAKIYKNGSPYGPERSKSNSGTVNVSADLSFTEGDLCQLWCYSSGGSNVSVDTYTVKYDMGFGNYTFVTA